MPARPLHAAWAPGRPPAVEWFIGPVDVVHGTNFVVPPTRRAAAVVSVHDLTPLHHPELCDAGHAGLSGADPPGAARGALGPHRLGLRGRRGRRGLRRGSRPRPGRPPGRARPPAGRRRDGDGHAWPASCPRARALRAWPSARPSRARTCPGWSAPSTRWRDGTPTSPWCWPARPAGARRRWPPPSARRRPRADRPHRLGRRRRRWRAYPGSRRAGLPVALRGLRLPAAAGHGAGVPVVATAAGSLPEVLGDGALLVERRRPRTRWPTPCRLPERRALRRQLIAAGPVQAARFRWDRCGDGPGARSTATRRAEAAG